MSKTDDIKTFTVRFSRAQWIAVKKLAIDRDISMNELVLSCIDQVIYGFKNNFKKSDGDVLTSP